MAGIIKAGRWHETADSPRAASFNFEDVSKQADGYLESVQQQAEQIIKHARHEARQIAEQAKELGRREAKEEAEAAVRQTFDQQLATLVPALQQAVNSIHESKQAWIKHWEDRAIKLSAGIAQRLIRRELTQTPDIAVNLVREALELAAGSGQVTIRMNPGDYDTLKDRVENVVRAIETLAEATIVADDDVSLGGCRVTTEFGTIDQTFETQLDRIEEELT